MPDFRTIHTASGIASMANAQASGVPVSLTHIAIGDGGGMETDPSEFDTALVNEVYRAPVSRVAPTFGNPLRFIVEVFVPANVGGFTIREIGVIDSSGNLFAVGNLAAAYKSVAPEPGASVVRVFLEFDVPSSTVVAISSPASLYPTTARPLGIPAPATPLTAVKNAGTYTGDVQTYFYTYTYVNDWGWEGGPAPASAQHDRESDATSTLSAFAAPPAGNYQINRIRIYRTQSGVTGATEFFFLREIAVGTATTQDDNRLLGEVLPTATNLPAPADLSFLTSGWNGMTFGISDGALRPSEAYIGYSFPLQYEIIPPDSKAVALGVFGQSVLVLTTGRPLLVSGSSPDSLDQMPLEIPQACIAPRSVASMGSGVAWASKDGLCWYGVGGPRILTAGDSQRNIPPIMTREQWLSLRPETIIASFYEGLYFASFDDGTGRKSFMLDPMNPTGLYFLDAGFTALHFDELQDQLYVLNGTNVQRWDAGATFMTVTARSKEFRAPAAVNFGAAEVVADTYPVTFRVYADGVLRHTQTVTSRNPFHLPSGFMALDWQLEAETASAVQGFALASTMRELSQV